MTLTAGGGTYTGDNENDDDSSIGTSIDRDDASNIKKLIKNDDNVSFVIKVLPSPIKNKNGSYISDIRVSTIYKKKPYTDIDNLNTWIYNFINYAQEMGHTVKQYVKNDEGEYIKDDKGNLIEHIQPKKDSKKYLPYDKTVFAIENIKHKGGKKSNKKKKTIKKYKYNRKTKKMKN
jgi:hypothetical protein